MERAIDLNDYGLICLTLSFGLGGGICGLGRSLRPVEWFFLVDEEKVGEYLLLLMVFVVVGVIHGTGSSHASSL